MPAAGPVLALLLAGATFIGGYYLGSQAGEKAGYHQGSAEATRVLKAKVQASGIFPKAVGPVHSLSGKVTAVRADGFDFMVQQGVQNPLEDSASAKRMVTVTSSTKISKMSFRTPAELDATQKEFSSALQKFSGKPGETPPSPPSAFNLQDAKLSDITDGAMVSVTADADITSAASISASDVSIQPAPEQPPAPPGAPGAGAPPAPGVVPPPAPAKK
jgi:hypothetical protein